jgi:hypothetical protein
MNPIWRFSDRKQAQPYPGFFALRAKPQGLYLVRYYMGPKDGELHHLIDPAMYETMYQLLIAESGAFTYVWMRP